MGKLRPQYTSAGDMAAGLAQWIGRKLRNHDPMEAHDKGRNGTRLTRHKRGVISFDYNFERDREGNAYCGIVKDHPHIVQHGLADGRVFEITVREIEPEIAATTELVAVGQ